MSVVDQESPAPSAVRTLQTGVVFPLPAPPRVLQSHFSRVSAFHSQKQPCHTVLDSLEFLATSPSVDELARKLIEGFAVTKTGPRDAVHISLAAANEIEYFSRWNRKHIVNPMTSSAIERICRDAGFVPPMICTPDKLLESENGIRFNNRKNSWYPPRPCGTN